MLGGELCRYWYISLVTRGGTGVDSPVFCWQLLIRRSDGSRWRENRVFRLAAAVVPSGYWGDKPSSQCNLRIEEVLLKDKQPAAVKHNENNKSPVDFQGNNRKAKKYRRGTNTLMSLRRNISRLPKRKGGVLGAGAFQRPSTGILGRWPHDCGNQKKGTTLRERNGLTTF